MKLSSVTKSISVAIYFNLSNSKWKNKKKTEHMLNIYYNIIIQLQVNIFLSYYKQSMSYFLS